MYCSIFKEQCGSQKPRFSLFYPLCSFFSQEFSHRTALISYHIFIGLSIVFQNFFQLFSNFFVSLKNEIIFAPFFEGACTVYHTLSPLSSHFLWGFLTKMSHHNKHLQSKVRLCRYFPFQSLTVMSPKDGFMIFAASFTFISTW